MTVHLKVQFLSPAQRVRKRPNQTQNAKKLPCIVLIHNTEGKKFQETACQISSVSGVE